MSCRYGKIMSIVALANIKRGEEIFAHYGYHMMTAPVWYRNLWLQHLRSVTILLVDSSYCRKLTSTAFMCKQSVESWDYRRTNQRPGNLLQPIRMRSGANEVQMTSPVRTGAVRL